MFKRFNLAGKQYTVKLVKYDTDNLGLARSAVGEIEVQTHWLGREIPEEMQVQTAYHEVVHCILEDIGRNDLSNDETLVQTLSALMYQFEQSKK